MEREGRQLFIDLLPLSRTEARLLFSCRNILATPLSLSPQNMQELFSQNMDYAVSAPAHTSENSLHRHLLHYTQNKCILKKQFGGLNNYCYTYFYDIQK